MNVRLTTGVVVALIGVVSEVRAGVIISSLNGNDLTQSADLRFGRNKGMGFTTPSGIPLAIDGVTLRLQTFGAAVSPVVQLWSNTAANLPGAPLFQFLNPTFALTGIQNYDFAAPTPFVLQPDTSYWVVASSTTGGRFDWKGSTPGVLPTGLAKHLGSFFDSNGPPPTTTSGILNSYAVRATAVPEPATLTVFALGTAGLLVRLRRR